jgi:rare lipoprotein A
MSLIVAVLPAPDRLALRDIRRQEVTMRFIVQVAAAATMALSAMFIPASAEDRHEATSRHGKSVAKHKADGHHHGHYGAHKATTGKRHATAKKKRKARHAHHDHRARKHAHAKRKHHYRKASGARHASGGGSVGMASYYWQPQRVASGGWFNPNAMTAAHKTLPFGTRVRVTHLGNGRSVTVTINDRGPYIAGRIIDLSRAAASAISMTGQGVARIQMVVLGR